ncbi:hypothetical protein GCM10025794_31260 [Massilia kyonggiensis]|jgi:hypothetical protein
MREGLIVEVPENFANKSGDYDLIIRQTDLHKCVRGGLGDNGDFLSAQPGF